METLKLVFLFTLYLTGILFLISLIFAIVSTTIEQIKHNKEKQEFDEYLVNLFLDILEEELEKEEKKQSKKKTTKKEEKTEE